MSSLTDEQKRSARPLPIFKDFLRKAIREGHKTETRRLIKPQPPRTVAAIECELYHPLRVRKDGEEYPAEERYGFAGDDSDWPCPYGKPGDIAYLREPLWRDDRVDYSEPPREVIYADTPEWCLDHNGDYQRCFCPDGYLPTREESQHTVEQNPHWSTGAWTSMTMPRWAARTFVRLTEICVERVQDIDEAGAIAEGVDEWIDQHETPFCRNHPAEFDSNGVCTDPESCDCEGHSYVEHFEELWKSINGDESWDINPWVWVVKWEPVDA